MSYRRQDYPSGMVDGWSMRAYGSAESAFVWSLPKAVGGVLRRSGRRRLGGVTFGTIDMRRHITIVQPAMPTYRRALFERMANKLGSTLVVYASNQRELGVLSGGNRPSWHRDFGRMRPLLLGLDWQEGACSVAVRRGDVLVICGAPRTLSTVVLLFKGIFVGAHTIWWGHYWSSTSRPWRAAIRYALMRLPDAIIFYTEQEVDEYCAGGSRRKPVFGLNTTA